MAWTDSDILQQFRDPRTREKAFTVLTQQYSKRVYWHVRRMVEDHEDANDITQNVLVKVWRKLDDFREEAGLFTWIYRIATNEALSFLEQRNRRQSVPLEPESASAAAGAYLDAEEAEDRLHHAINTLPARQKQVFLLRYYDEMPYEEMSSVLDTSVGALKASYHHAVQKIKEQLTGH